MTEEDKHDDAASLSILLEKISIFLITYDSLADKRPEKKSLKLLHCDVMFIDNNHPFKINK